MRMLWKKATLLGLAGFVLGVLTGIGFMLARSSEGLKAAFPNLLLSGIYSAVVTGSSIVYDIEEWSIARATATHFLLSFSLYFLLVLSMGWFRLDDPVFWIVVAVMVVGYVLIWLLQYLSYKRKIREMNHDLKIWKSTKKELDDR